MTQSVVSQSPMIAPNGGGVMVRAIVASTVISVAMLISFGEYNLLALSVVVVFAVGLGAAIALGLDKPATRVALIPLLIALALGNQFWALRFHDQTYLVGAIFLAFAVVAFVTIPGAARKWALMIGGSVSLTLSALGVAETWGKSPIDIFDTQFAAAHALINGHDPYAATVPTVIHLITGTVFTNAHFPYGPATVLLDVPGLLVGDLRLGYLVAVVVLIGATILAAPSGRIRDYTAALCIANPLLVAMVFYSYVDLFSMVGTALWLALRQRSYRVAVLALGVALATKPTIWFAVLPMALCSRQLLKEIATAIGIAVGMSMPFAIVAGPVAFLTDTVQKNSAVGIRPDALTLEPLFAAHGVSIPWPIVAMAPVVLTVAIAWWRRPQTVGEACTLGAFCCTGILLVAPSAYLNYYFVAAWMLVLSVALAGTPVGSNPTDYGHQANGTAYGRPIPRSRFDA
jgi:hypothetical protein